MHIENAYGKFTVTLTERERDSGLVQLLEDHLPKVGILYSPDKLIWQIDNRWRVKFDNLVNYFVTRGSQLNLFWE